MINLVDININAKVRYMTELIDNTASSYTVKNMLSTEQYYDSMMFQDAFISEYFENLDSSFGAVNNVIILKDSKVILNRNADREVALVDSPDRRRAIRRQYSSRTGLCGMVLWTVLWTWRAKVSGRRLYRLPGRL